MSSGPFSSLELEFGGTVAKSGGIKSSSSSSSTSGGGESELRKQILASGALPVAIDPKKSDDGSQRYIMPSVLVKRSGAHGGAASLSNFHFLCQCLKRPPAVLLKFLGAEFGCRVVHSKDPRGVDAHDNYTLIGSFEDDRLQAAIHKFNERCVLCHRCRDPVGRLQHAGQFGDVSKDLAKKSASFLANELPTATGQAHVSTAPHTVAKALKGLSVGKLKPLLVLDCGGCGHVSFLDPADKLQNLLSVALAQKEEEAAKLQKLEEKKKAQLQERKKKQQQLLEKEEEGHEVLPEDAARIIKKEPTATNEQAEGGSLSSTAPPPSAGLAQEEGKGVAGTLPTGEEEKKVQKEKKPKKEKKEKGGDDDTEVAAVLIPPDAVAMLVSEIKKTSSNGANVPPSESSVKSLVSDVCRLFGVEGGKQAKCQLVLRALVAAGVLLVPIAPNVAALLLLPTTGTAPPSDPSSSKSDDDDGEKMMKDALVKGWLQPWLGSKSLTKAAAAEFSSSSSNSPEPVVESAAA